ncbi:PoNi-like cognate immunity protein [Hymenobacter weizhouensis]|uniref:PoNi-like cognate immunity protein n=1 Tax=Hymenobacter sp. YIM 151500-1 TaxID=2987689 RepID=UPI002226E48C|nr:PoNi-like cognate immunity protein [Hymenobacter sp. YIM 151500-1]UYZ64252.1 PoNi-like cognate immunity protein [Hymenobacter sp. YIM 151500-1]
MNESYFDNDIELVRAELLVLEDEKRLPPEEIKLDLVYLCDFNYRSNLVSSLYSRGYAIEEIRNEFVALVSSLEQFVHYSAAENEGIFFNGEMDGYTHAVALLSLGLLLRVDTDVFRRLVEAIGLNGQDYLLEWLAGRRLPQRPPTVQLLFPKTYARLRDAIQAPRDITPQLLKSFLAHWYESVDTMWYECHLGPEGGGFTGYWCWEAAAVAFALRVDDSELQTMRYYPKDLADFAFGRKPQPA